jgi:hypothetical protein
MDNIPGVKATAKAKSKSASYNTWSSPASAVVTYDTRGTAAAVVGGAGWLYSDAASAGSDFWVNSIAGDMKSTASVIYEYTMYGYE